MPSPTPQAPTATPMARAIVWPGGPPPAVRLDPPPRPAAASQAATEPAGGFSVIGDNLAILGEHVVIVTRGTLQIDGAITGDVHCNRVIVGRHGRVDGTICADTVEVRGAVNGTIRSPKVELTDTAVVDGVIHHLTLVMQEGARFDGTLRRPGTAAELTPNLDRSRHGRRPAPLRRVV
jgi:cytoskeletal protein CcmA (bactofilin family)